MKKLLLIAFSIFCFLPEAAPAEPFDTGTLDGPDNPVLYGMGSCKIQFNENTAKMILLGYYEPYGVKALSSRRAGIILPVRNSQVWEFFYRQTGDSGWQENQAGLQTYILSSQGLKIGFCCSALFLHTANNQKDFALIPALKTTCKLDEKTSLGVILVNPTQSLWGKTKQGYLRGFSVHSGLQYCTNKNCRMQLEASFNTDQPLTLKGGMEYLLLKKFTLRCGYHTQPDMPSWGIGLQLKQTMINWSSSLHSVLGFSHSFSVAYSWI